MILVKGEKGMDTQALNMMRTIMMTASMLSLLGAALPILWGQVKVKWLVTGMMSCLMFGVMGTMVTVFAPEADVAEVAVASSGDAGPGALKLVGIVVGIIVLLYAAGMAAGYATDLNRRRKARKSKREAAVDPVKVAQAHAPEMLDDVRLAMTRIERIRTIGAEPDTSDGADALVLAEKRLPSLMRRCAVAMEAAVDDGERAEAARTALGAVVQIGRAAEDARKRVAGGLRNDLDTESRYIATRTGANALGLD